MSWIAGLTESDFSRSARSLPISRLASRFAYRSLAKYVGLAHPTRFERVAFAFGGRRSIQLSYGAYCLRSAYADFA
jgi:hypothetical protein